MRYALLHRRMGLLLLLTACAFAAGSASAADEPTATPQEKLATLQATIDKTEKLYLKAMEQARTHAPAVKAFEASPELAALVARWDKAIVATDAATAAKAPRRERMRLENAEQDAARAMYEGQERFYRKVENDLLIAANEAATLDYARVQFAVESGQKSDAQKLTQSNPVAAVRELDQELTKTERERLGRCLKRESGFASYSIGHSVNGMRRVLEINFQEQSFEEAMTWMRDIFQINIWVDWERIKQAGLAEARITLKLLDVPTTDALQAVIKAANGATKDHPLRLWMDGPLVLVSTEAGVKAWQARFVQAEALVDAHPQLEAKLTQRIPEARFEDARLEDCLRSIAEQAKAEVKVDWTALEAAGLKRDIRVNFALYSTRLIDLLSIVLHSSNANESVSVTVIGDSIGVGKRK